MVLKKAQVWGILLLLGIALIGFFIVKKGFSQQDVAGVSNVIDSEVIRIFARGSYQPKQVTVSAGKQLTLRMVTNSTYDCTAALVVPKLGINTTLPPTAETDFVIPPQVAGTVITGSCSSGSDGFQIKFL